MFLTSEQLLNDDFIDFVNSSISKPNRKQELIDKWTSNESHFKNIIEKCLTKTQLQSLDHVLDANERSEPKVPFSSSSKNQNSKNIFNQDNHNHITYHDKMVKIGLPSLLPLYLFICRIFLNIIQSKIEVQEKDAEKQIRYDIGPKDIDFAWCCLKTMKHSLNDAIQIYQLYKYLTQNIEFGSGDYHASMLGTIGSKQVKREIQNLDDYKNLKSSITNLFNCYLTQLIKFVDLSCKSEILWWQKFDKKLYTEHKRGFTIKIDDNFVIEEFEYALKCSVSISEFFSGATSNVIVNFHRILHTLVHTPTKIFNDIMGDYKNLTIRTGGKGSSNSRRHNTSSKYALVRQLEAFNTLIKVQKKDPLNSSVFSKNHHTSKIRERTKEKEKRD